MCAKIKTQVRRIVCRIALTGLILLLVLGGSGLYSAKAQEETKAISIQASTSSIFIDFDTIVKVPDYLQAPITQAIAARASILPNTTYLYSTAFRLSENGDWARIVLVPSYVIENDWENLVANDIIEILAQRQSTATWTVHLYKDEDFPNYSQSVPLTFINFAPLSALSTFEYRFPWTAGQSWWKNGGWHTNYGDGSTNNAVDFQPKSTASADIAVLAAAEGLLDVICGPDANGQMWLKITNADGVAGYGHLDASTVPQNLIGKSVLRGQFLGNLYNPGGYFKTYCGSGTATHLHFIFPTRNLTMYDSETQRDVSAEEIGTDTGIGNVSYTSNNVRVENPPPSFKKSLPLNGATNQPANVTLVWTPLAGAEKYQYCTIADISKPCTTIDWQDNDDLSTDKTIGPLSPGTTYYWQVRALKNGTWIEADNGTWWSFKVASVPGAFTKKPPTPAAQVTSGTPITLGWSSSSNATKYEYCYDTTNNNACDDPASWKSVGNTTSATISGLSPATYYWQVRAINVLGVDYAAYADNNAWHSFTILPAGFGKTSPYNGHLDQPRKPTLQWIASPDASGYQYCISTTAGSCAGSTSPFTWTDVTAAPVTELGVTTFSVTIEQNLSLNTTYYWQVRAVTNQVQGQYTYANGDASTGSDSAASWWSFRVPPTPGAFTLLAPANGATNVKPVSVEGITAYLLQWGESSDATRYEYCIDTINDGICNASWKATKVVSQGIPRPCMTLTCVELTNLSLGTTYYWQARAKNAVGTIYASDGWYAFTTAPPPPGAFNKTAPANGQVYRVLPSKSKTTVNLAWGTSSNAVSYEYCIDNQNNGVCDNTWVSSGNLTSISLDLPLGAYYWQVRAVNSAGVVYADQGAWYVFTITRY